MKPLRRPRSGMWAVMDEIRSGKLVKTALKRLKHRLLDVRGQQLGHVRG